MKEKSFGAESQRSRRRPKDEQRMNFLEKGGCVFFLGLPLCRFASACPLVMVLGRLVRVRPVSVPCVVLSFVACPLLLAGCVALCGRRPEDRHSFSRYPLGYVSQPTPCGIDCQGAAAGSETSVRCSCRNFGTCIITVMLPFPCRFYRCIRSCTSCCVF